MRNLKINAEMQKFGRQLPGATGYIYPPGLYLFSERAIFATNLIVFGVPALAGRFSSRLKAVHRTRKHDYIRPLNRYPGLPGEQPRWI
jgi:hypothetical protein